ncbi:MAG: WbqC family protein [Pseudomonadota bacterium]
MNKASGKTVAILQPNYIPWRGYFDLIAQVDEFIVYDDTQYTRRDWRNRNRIWTPAGVQWLTIPVETKGAFHQLIREVRIADDGWRKSHFARLRHSYGGAPFFPEVMAHLAPLYEGAGFATLLEADMAFLAAACALLGIATPLTLASDYDVAGARTDKLVALCQAAGATRYISGPAARAYIAPEKFAGAGIALSYIAYGDYPPYRQMAADFTPRLSILDTLFCLGGAGARASIAGSRLEDAA